MNNMRRGFTMIELIFVIVIIGILAAVAIPKLQGVSEDAEIAKIQAYAGTLSRSILPAVWSKSLRENNGGALVAAYDTDIKRDLPAPGGITFTTPGSEFSGNVAPVTTNFVTAVSIAGSVVATETIGSQTYSIVCRDGDKYNSPACDVWDPISGRYMLGSKNQ